MTRKKVYSLLTNRGYKIILLIIVIAYILLGIRFYLADLDSRRSIAICPIVNQQTSDSAIYEEPSFQGCEKRKLPITEELHQAILTTIFWLPLVVGSGLSESL